MKSEKKRRCEKQREGVADKKKLTEALWDKTKSF